MTEKELIIQELRRENAELRAKVPRWISVDDEIPPVEQEVIMYFVDKNMAFGWLSDVDEEMTFWSAYTDGGWTCDCDEIPTHWMPLPEPPEEAGT